MMEVLQSSTEILDENHYCSYGMEMTDPSWYNGTEYKYKYNGIERTESLGLCIDLALYRGLDPVLGKWYQADPKAESIGYMSPYCSMGNNPVSNVDPEGDWIHIAIGAAVGGLFNLDTKLYQGKVDNFGTEQWHWVLEPLQESSPQLLAEPLYPRAEYIIVGSICNVK